MRRIDKALQSVDSRHRQEGYVGPLASTSAGGHNANVNNLYNSQVRDAKTVMPYGVSSRPPSGVKAQTIVNDNSDNVVVGIYDPARPKVGVGEVCLYSAGGCAVYLSANGIITIESGNNRIVVSKSSISINGSVDISEDVGVDGNINISKDADVTGNADIKGNVEVGEDIDIGGDANIDGNIEVGGNISVSGSANVSGLSINGVSIESIIDTKINNAISRLN